VSTPSPRLLALLPLVLATTALAGQVRGQPAARVSTFELHGSVDPPGRLEEFVALFVPAGSFYVEPGPADDVGTPVATIPRLERALERLGYHAVIEATPARAGGEGPQIHLSIHLRAFDRVRQIFVRGNWPLRQDEIVRRLSLRPGQALPLSGADRDARIERERLSVLAFLRDQGYLEAQVSIELRSTRAIPAPVDLVVRIELGPGYPVGPVKVEGNRALSAEEIGTGFRHLDWRFLWSRPLPFRLSLLREDLAVLTERYRGLGYAGVRISTDYDPANSIDPVEKQVRLGLTINERKRVEVAFEGNRRFDDSDLKERLTIFTRGAYDSFEAEASAGAIAQLYRGRGHMFVRVTWRAESLSPEVHRIVFSIVEGPSLKIRGVSFVGNHAFPDSRLAGVVTVNEFPFLGFLGIGEGGYASFRQLELDVERLTTFYAESGYPETRARCEIAPAPGRWQPAASVREDDPAWQAAKALYVRFIIEEPARVDVGEVRFEISAAGAAKTAGADPLPYSEAFLRDSLDAKEGEPYRPAVLRSDGARLKRLLGDAGYPEASPEPLAEREGNRVRITWQITLGPRVRVGPLFVRGNFLTRESTVARWSLLRPGDRLTTTAFERSQRNLALVQLFNNASPISLPPEAQAGDVMPVVVEVEERHDHWGVIRVGGGASTEQAPPASGVPLGFYAAIGYEHRNLFGQGWTLLSRGEYGNSVTRVNADLLDPRFLGTAFRLEVSGNYLRQSTVRLGDIRSGGGSIGFAREMYPGVDAALRYGLRNTFRTEFLVRGAGPDAEQETVRLGTTVGSLMLALEWHRLDNQLVPTRGFKVQAGLELAAPAFSFHAGEDSFIKTGVRSLVVVPLGPRLSLRHSVRYDQGFPLAGASLLPKVERFFAGGDTTIRGFELDRARQEAIRAPLASNVEAVDYRPVGGSLRVLQNVDLQLRLAGPWHASLFFDSGVVADSFSALSPTTFRHGVGVAPLLFKLPIGDISMAWAWPLDPQPGDSRTGRIHFNVGLMF
jgi:outer membrane protein insertion porin family